MRKALKKVLAKHKAEAEDQKARTGFSRFLELHEEFANPLTFIRSPNIAIASGYIPTNLDIMALVCAMSCKRMVKSLWEEAVFNLDGMETTFKGLLMFLLNVAVLCIILLTPILWPISYVMVRYVIMPKVLKANLCIEDLQF